MLGSLCNGQFGGHVHCFEHFAEQHRRRQHGVVARVAADIGQVQRFARRKQGFQQQVAIIQPPGTVAAAWMATDQIETRGRRTPGKGSIVQP